MEPEAVEAAWRQRLASVATRQIDVPGEKRLALARIVCKTGRACLLDARNAVSGYASLGEAVATQAAYFGQVRSEILAIDFDDDDAMAHTMQTYAALLWMGYLSVVVTSGRDDHAHLFCRVSGPDRERVVRAAKLKPIQVRSTIRPPLTPHRWGMETSLVLPSDPDEAIARLTGAHSIRAVGSTGAYVLLVP